MQVLTKSKHYIVWGSLHLIYSMPVIGLNMAQGFTGEFTKDSWGTMLMYFDSRGFNQSWILL